ncbi:MAG: hypothetical protein HY816_06735 [Candidatus Wallbacteria bacterium]|nr:hypothetical protein [Candidatus Wallbacteria bacterium]
MLFYRRSVRVRVGPVERTLCVALLAALGAIALWVRHRGGQVDEDLFRLKESALAATNREQTLYRRPVASIAGVAEGEPAAALLSDDLLGAAFRRDGAVSSFGPENLYEKIDGREGLYKSYGFRKLWTATYVSTTSPEATVDVEIFLQATPRDAFGVFSTERQGAAAGGSAAGLAELPNGLYAVREAYYVRVLGSESSARVTAAARGVLTRLDALARPGPAQPTPVAPGSAQAELVGARPPTVPASPARESRSPEAWTASDNPLIDLGADPATLRYQAENGLGMEYFAGLYSGDVREGQAQVRVFLFPAKDEAAAREVFTKYSAYLRSQGDAAGQAAFPGSPPGAVAVRDRLLNTWEWAFLKGRFVGGATEAADSAAAARVVSRLEKGLAP